jgi:hypothetical protein
VIRYERKGNVPSLHFIRDRINYVYVRFFSLFTVCVRMCVYSCSAYARITSVSFRRLLDVRACMRSCCACTRTRRTHSQLHISSLIANARRTDSFVCDRASELVDAKNERCSGKAPVVPRNS